MRSILFALTEPEDGDEHMVFVDGLLMSSGSEGYKLPAAGGVRGRTPSVPGQPNTGSQDGRVSGRGTLVWVDGLARCCAADGE